MKKTRKLSEEKKFGIALVCGVVMMVAMVVGIHTAAAYITSSGSIGTLTYTDKDGNEKKVPISNRPSFSPRRSVVAVHQVIGMPFGHMVTVHDLSWEQELVLEQLGTEVSTGDGDGKGVILLEGDYKSFKKVIVPEESEEDPFYFFTHTWILGGPARGIAQPPVNMIPPPPPPAS